MASTHDVRATGAHVRPRSAIALAVTLIAVALSLVAPAPRAQATGTTVPMSAFSGLVVDPDTQRVFLAGDDKVVAFAADGTMLATIPNVYGAGRMAFSGGYLWVTQTTAASIAKINPTTLAKVGEYATGGPIYDSVAAIGGKIWFVSNDGSAYSGALKVLDPATGTVSSRGPVAGINLVSIPGSTTRLLAADEGLSPYSVYLYDITANPAVQLADVPHGLGSNLGGAVATEVGTFITASGAPYRFDEVSTTPNGSLLEPTGVVYPATHYPNAITYSPAAGGVVAGTTSSTDKLFVSQRGVPRSTHEVQLPGDPLRNGVGLSPNAQRAYTATEAATGVTLSTFSLAPTFATATLTSVVRTQATPVTITGTGLGSIDSATLGGADVDFAHDGPGTLDLDVRTTIAPGPTTLELSGPFGGLSVPFTVTANGTGTVSGTVTANGAPVAGATVTLTGDAGPTGTTTAADGTYAIPAVPNGTHYDLVIAKGSSSHAWRDLSLQGAGPFTYDLDLLAPPASTLQRRKVDLPPGAVTRLVRDPASGRTFVAVGDEVVVFDADGRQVKRIHDQWTASDLQVVGSKLYVMLQRAGRYSVIDIPSLTVTKSVVIGRLNTGAFAVAGNRLFFTDGDDQWTSLASIDLTTNAITTVSGSQYTPRLGPIDGAPLHFLSWEVGISSSDVIHWDASAGTVTQVASTGFGEFGYNPSDLVASSSANRAWAADGRELNLSTMDLTGVTYPTANSLAVARSGGHGGVLAFGQKVALQGKPIATHELPAAPAGRASAFDAAGDRSFVATSTGQLVVSDLAPIVNSISPGVLVETPGSVNVAGVGLGGATAVEIDGEPVPFVVADPQHVNVTVPTLPEGDHELVVTTPWGSSSPLVFGSGASSVPYYPFASWSAMVTRLHTDLTGTPPTTAALDSWTIQLASEAKAPGDLVEALRRDTDNTTAVDPVARLYRAFLGRTPDASGLKFWVGRKRAGTWTVTRVADSFAASSEFKRKYGTLTNRAFVTRIYTDVMGRTADPSGVDYWTSKLDRKLKTRGQVMVGFSESSEYRRKQADNTDVAVTYIYLLGRAPTTAEVDAWAVARKAGTTPAELAGDLVASEGYADHIFG